MALSVVVLVLGALAAVVVAVPTWKVTCSNGHVVRDGACCKWFNVLDDIQTNLFDGEKCDQDAHESLRLTFHDAAGYSLSAQQEGKFGGGGADGSIMAFAEIETNYPPSFGLDEIVEAQRPFALKHNVSFGDFIQFAGAVAVSNCNGGPRLQFLAGRSNHSRPAPPGTLPDPFSTADQIFARFEDAGFCPEEVVALLAAHSVSAQHTVDPTINGAPFDSTPSSFDGQFFLETMLKGTHFPGNGSHKGEAMSPLPGEFRLQSDFELARDPRSACAWQTLATQHDLMVLQFEKVMAKMATLGQNPAHLIDCSEVIPVPRRLKGHNAIIPAGKKRSDIEIACHALPFPALPTVPGPLKSVAPVLPS